MKIGKLTNIVWGNGNNLDNVCIQLSRDIGSTYEDLVSNTASNGSLEWRVTGPATTQAKLKVYVINNPVLASISPAFAIEAITISSSNTVRTNLRQALKACLLEITAINQYRNTIRAVYDPPVNYEKMTQFPCVNIYYGDEVVL